jgi:FkbM family methyltransferase
MKIKLLVYLKNNFKFYGLNAFKIFFKDLFFKIEEKISNGKLKKIKLYDFEMLIPLGIEGIGRGLYVYGGRELDHKWILEKTLQKNDTIFDLGANIGYYIMLENFILDGNCKIFAVEPDPRNIKVLSENILNSNLTERVKFEQVAISNFTGKADLIFSNRTNLNRLKFDTENKENDSVITVPVIDFIEYLSKLPTINIMRMDIEGAEIDVFDSIIENYKKSKTLILPKRIVFETHNYDQNKGKMKNYLAKLFEIGYEVEYLASDDEHKNNPIIKSLGYSPIEVIQESSCTRGIYTNINPLDSINLISNWNGTRTVCLKFK